MTPGAAGGEGSRPPDVWQIDPQGQTVGGYGGPWLGPGAARAGGEISRSLGDGGRRVVPGTSFGLETNAARAARSSSPPGTARREENR